MLTVAIKLYQFLSQSYPLTACQSTIMSTPPVHVNDLPPEIFLHIFRCLGLKKYAVRRCIAEGEANILKMAVPPYSIANVCRYWDDVTALAPELWDDSHILISLDPDDNQGAPGAHTMRRYFERAPHSDTFHVRALCKEGNSSFDEPDHALRVAERKIVLCLLPIFGAHLTRINTLHIQTRYATSLPPQSAFCPRPGVNGTTLCRFQVGSQEAKRLKDPPIHLPGWPPTHSPRFLSLLPSSDVALDLMGFTFTSICRDTLALNIPLLTTQLPDIYRKVHCKELTIRSLFSNSESPDALTLEEFIRFLRLNLVFHAITMYDVDLVPSPGSQMDHGVPPPGTGPATQEVMLYRIGTQTLCAIISLYHIHGFCPGLEINDCKSDVPLQLTSPPPSIKTLSLHSLDVSTIINILHAAHANMLIIGSGCILEDGTELLRRLEEERRGDGSRLLSQTKLISLWTRQYFSLTALCQFAEAWFTLDLSSPSRERGLQITITQEVSDEGWEKMQTEILDWECVDFEEKDKLLGPNSQSWNFRTKYLSVEHSFLLFENSILKFAPV